MKKCMEKNMATSEMTILKVTILMIIMKNRPKILSQFPLKLTQEEATKKTNMQIMVTRIWNTRRIKLR